MICSMLPSTHFHSPLSFHLRKIDVHWYFRKCCCLVAKLCPTLCDPKDCSSPDYSVHGISQVRILKWVAISFSRASSQPMDQNHISCMGRQILYCWATREAHFREYHFSLFFTLFCCFIFLWALVAIQISSVQSLSHVQLFATPWTAARQASLSITNSQSLLKLMSIQSVMPSNHLILCRPLLLPPIFLSIGVFSNESALRIRWPK